MGKTRPLKECLTPFFDLTFVFHIGQMLHKMLCCDINQFLHYYAPFVPSKHSVDNALQKLEHEELLYSNKWRDFNSNDIPSKTGKIEGEAFKKLKDIVKALMGQKCSGTDPKGPRKCNHTWLGKFQKVHFR